jgi:putative transposase
MVNREEMLSIRCQCDLVSVNRGSFYYQPLGETEENLRVMRLMDEHYLKRPSEGVKRVRDFLLALGIIANHKSQEIIEVDGINSDLPKEEPEQTRPGKVY